MVVKVKVKMERNGILGQVGKKPELSIKIRD
jgi:hypothetical protein